LTNAAGCDSIATLDLTVKAESYSTTKVDICSKEAPYLWHGKSYSFTGIYKDTLVNAVGCDSIATLELTVKAESYSTTTMAICSKNAPYLWNGKSYSLSGIYKDTLTNAAGCDSIATLELTVKAESYSTTAIAICSNEAPFIWHGKSYSSTGIYKDTLVNVAGCDSIATLELTVKEESYSTTKVDICSKEAPYIWNGKSYSLTGIYKDTLTNTVGCDSIATLELKVNKESIVPVREVTICEGDSVSFFGKYYKQSGTYQSYFTNKYGCDSIVSLKLTVNKVAHTYLMRVICPLQLPYKWNGINCLGAGSYMYRATSANGCDSIVQLNLRVEDPIRSSTTVTLCRSDLPFSWNGISCQEAGSYTVRLKTPAGCDSVAMLKLQVLPVNTEVKAVNLCEGESYVYDGTLYNSPGSYEVHLQSATGCDSVMVLVLRYSKGSTTSQVVYLVPNETYSANGKTYSDEGVYTEVFKSANNCDSLVITEILHLKIPNTMTPNGDGINDCFMRGYKVQIYNRNGILFFEGNNGWDGTRNGVPVVPGTYFYVLYYQSGTELKSKQGYITVVR
jgi:gliding motility-associated-like protein